MKNLPIWKDQLLQARERYMLEKYPYLKQYGVPLKSYSDTKANGLTRCILDFLQYHGHYANRINTTGMQREINGRTVWTKGSTRKGTADVHAIINGRSVSIEIKIGRDKMSEAQLREQQRVTAAGGIYLVVTCMDEFYRFFLNLTHENLTTECAQGSEPNLKLSKNDADNVSIST